mgnify:CR=1 FL=1
MAEKFNHYKWQRNNLITEDGHTDVASAKRKLKLSMEDATEMLEKLESMNSEGDLQSWWMGKITIASDYLNTKRRQHNV